LDEVSVTRKLGSHCQKENKARPIVMQKLNTTDPVMDDQKQILPSKWVKGGVAGVPPFFA
jgi:hypothetical protein